MKIEKAFSNKELKSLPFYYRYFVRYTLNIEDQQDRDNQLNKKKIKSLNKPISRLY